jgi:hypothetical protein
MRNHAFLLVLVSASVFAGCGAYDESANNEPQSERIGEAEEATTYACNPWPGSCVPPAASSTDAKKTYNATNAVTYALNNYSVPYGSSGGQNPFHNYGTLTAGNCTNFVSQAIMAGLSGQTTLTGAYNERFRYDVDAASNTQWYYRCDCDRGSAFTSPNELYKYANSNKPNYKGLHLQFVTKDTTASYLTVGAVQKGDIVFADWDNDTKMDHGMLVTNIDNSQVGNNGYNKIRVTYQYIVGTTNKGLGDLNVQYNYKALFYVYRVVDYNPSGL